MAGCVLQSASAYGGLRAELSGVVTGRHSARQLSVQVGPRTSLATHPCFSAVTANSFNVHTPFSREASKNK